MPSPTDLPGKAPQITRLGLIAGDGHLPVHAATNAVARGVDVVPFFFGRDNIGAIRKICGNAGHHISPGMIRQTLDLIASCGVSHIVMAGKANKWVLLRNLKMDDLALEAMRRHLRLNDDAIMLWITDQIEQRGMKVLPQTDYLRNLFIGHKTLTRRQPDVPEMGDLLYGFETAKEIGRLDIGQSIVISKGMILAVEAIEGTDECVKRGGKLAAKKGGALVKVAKPGQDQRFDVPTVGMRTLKNMHRAGLHILATEADETLYLDPEAMTEFADRHNMVIISTSLQALQQP